MLSIRQILFVLAAATAACAPTNEPPAGAAQEEVAELWSADTRTILTGDAARTLSHQCSRVSPGPVEDVWTPTDAEVAAIEDQLILLVARKMEEAGISPSPGGYHRQYAGLVIGGRRIIYVNGVDETAIQQGNDNWRTSPVQICDGGTITFGAEYDQVTQAISNFAFNGSV